MSRPNNTRTSQKSDKSPAAGGSIFVLCSRLLCFQCIFYFSLVLVVLASVEVIDIFNNDLKQAQA
jgi:hypothetical protein